MNKSYNELTSILNNKRDLVNKALENIQKKKYEEAIFCFTLESGLNIELESKILEIKEKDVNSNTTR